jgi:nucleotide-binding universal stress UspA family protein
MKILIGYDGSEYANAALRGLLKAGLPLKARAVVMSIPRPAPASNWNPDRSANASERANHGAYSEEEVEKAAAMAKQASDLVREKFPMWEVRADLAVGSAVSIVAKKASQWNPNLIVLGLQRCVASGRSYFDGVSRRIAIEAKCSVRVAQASGAETDDAPRVLLCVDGSQYTEAAVRAVADRDWPKGTEVRIFTVVDPFEYTIPEFVDKAIERAKLSHRAIANELDRTPAFTSSLVREGDPVKAILQEAEDWAPDSIFLAPRPRNRFHRLLLTSVSGRIVARAKCAVELARTVKPESRAVSATQTGSTSPAFD